MIRSSTILQHIKSVPLPRGALFVCLPKDSPTRHELLSRIVNPERRKKGSKAASIQAFPAWGKGTTSAALGCFRMQHKCASLSPILPAVFHTKSALSAPAGHLPLQGKAAIREYHLLKRRHTALVNLSAPQVPSSRAKPRDLYCTAAICTHAPSLKRHLGASFFAFPSLTIYRSARRIPPLRSG